MPLERRQIETIKDIILVTVVTFAVSLALIYSNFFEWWYDFSRARENWQLDELLGIFIAVLCAGTFLCVRHIFLLLEVVNTLQEARGKIARETKTRAHQDKMAALGEMASGLAHEINNALQPAMGLGYMIKDGLGKSGNTKHQDYMDIILSSVHHAKSVIDNVLAFSHQSNVGMTTYNADQVLQETLKFSSDIMPTSITFEFLSYAPTTADPQMIMCNKTSLCQIFINIFKNAAKAMDNSGSVRVLTKPDVMPDTNHPAISVSITDTGCGMDEDVIRRAFDPFFTTKDISEGTGLGMSVVLGLMNEHNGTINVTSVKGKGSTFTLFFPILATKEHAHGSI